MNKHSTAGINNGSAFYGYIWTVNQDKIIESVKNFVTFIWMQVLFVSFIIKVIEYNKASKKVLWIIIYYSIILLKEKVYNYFPWTRFILVRINLIYFFSRNGVTKRCLVASGWFNFFQFDQDYVHFDNNDPSLKCTKSNIAHKTCDIFKSTKQHMFFYLYRMLLIIKLYKNILLSISCFFIL